MKAVSVRVTLLSMALGLSACTATNYSTEVTRFHTAQQIGRGRIAIAPFAAPDGQPGGSGPEFDFYAGAVAQQLTALGWTVVGSGAQADQVALIDIEQGHYASTEHSPVSIGVGGGTGGWYGGGVGGGVGFDLGGGHREMTTATLSVRLKRQSDQSAFWEGRATVTARANRPEASPNLLAPRLAQALFQGFPGESGRTIRLP